MRLVAAVILALLVTGAHALEVPLEYRAGSPVALQNAAGDLPEDLTDSSFHLAMGFAMSDGRSVETSPTPPPGDWKLPELQTDKPLYAVIAFGDMKVIAVIDRTRRAAYYDRIYFDANGNGDLTDDPVVKGKADSEAFGLLKFSAFDPVEMPIAGTSEPLRFRFGIDSLRTTRAGGEVYPSLMLHADSFRVGKFEAGGQSYRVAVVDANSDGSIGQRSAPSGNMDSIVGDVIYVTASPAFATRDKHSLPGLLAIRGDTFEVDIDTTRSRLLLEPLTGETGALRLPDSPPQRMHLLPAEGGATVLAVDPAQEIRLPAGTYRLAGYTAWRRNESGAEWQLDADGHGCSPTLVAAGASVAFAAGEPYQGFVTARKTSKPSGGFFGMLFGAPHKPALELSFKLKGAGGEVIEAIRCTDRGTSSGAVRLSSGRPKAPTYKLVKADGELVASGSFAYG
jgi:hypothetical protein